MTKIAILADTHFGCRSNSFEHLENQRQFFENVFFPEIKARGIKTVIHLGDTFDHKKVMQYGTLDYVKSFFFDRIPELELEYHQIIGNHDCFYKNTNSVNSVQLLLSDYGKVYSTPEEIEIGGKKLLMLPWIAPDIYEQSINAIQDSKAFMAFGHLQLTGFELVKGRFSDTGLNKSLFANFASVLTGHFHKQQKDGNIHYVGTPYQWTWEDAGLEKGFHILDLNDASMEFIVNPFEMYHTIIFNEETSTTDLQDIKAKHVKVIASGSDDNLLLEKFMSAAEKVAIDVKLDKRPIRQIANNTLVIEDNFLKSVDNHVDSLVDLEDDKKSKVKDLFAELYTEVIQI